MESGTFFKKNFMPTKPHMYSINPSINAGKSIMFISSITDYGELFRYCMLLKLNLELIGI